MLDNICNNILLVKSEKLVNIFSKFVKIQYKTKMHFLYILVQFCWYYKKSEKVRFFLLWKSFLVSKGTNYQIIQGIRGDNTILDNLQPFCLLSEHSHILAMSISYVEGGTLWTNEFEKLSVQWKAQYSICRSSLFSFGISFTGNLMKSLCVRVTR